MKTIVKIDKNEIPKKMEQGIIYVFPNGSRVGMCDPINVEDSNPLTHLLEMLEITLAQ